MENFFYKVNDIDYEVVVTHKRIKNIHYRFIGGKFYVSCSRWTTKKRIIEGLDKHAYKMVKNAGEPALGEDYIYLFGNKVNLHFPGILTISDYEPIHYVDIPTLEKKLRPIILDFITSRVRHYESLMSLPTYKVTIRKMKSRLGSNSKRTKTLNFSTILIHYSVPIIDSVVVHELAHIKEFNHSKKFYDVVYKYCPNYKEYRKDLLRGNYHD